MFTEGVISGVIVRELLRYSDKRGWLMEVFRTDELHGDYLPAMGYISMTNPGLVRGPHEHVDQADTFCFLGPSVFTVFLWDNRPESATYRSKQVISAGEQAPKSIIIPAGVVHAYKNVGGVTGMVVNFPNRLYKGGGKRQPVDEIRHEDDPETIFRID